MGSELLLLIVGAVAFAVLRHRIATLERTVARLQDDLAATVTPQAAASRTGDVTPVDDPPEPIAMPRPPALQIASPSAESLASEAEPIGPSDAAPPARTLESLIGGQLPIWVGGAALVIAAFFLVRYSIESGLLGPGVRVALAALFSTALIGASEVARRLPATRDDRRIGQVLAGAGIASAYGTLYVAAAQYHLIGPLAGFLLMIAVTAAALFLALRHGPPTAIMALVGGFAAPLVAGFDAAGLGPLLVYLGLFIAALFALAAQRGWGWLALAALIAGFGWANLLIVLLDGRGTAGIGAFVVALAIGATLALPRTDATRRWLRAMPLVAGLVQLLVLAPTLDFGPVAWSFHLVLAAAALILAWRDDTIEPAAVAAACLVAAFVAAGLATAERIATPIAAVFATLLLGGTGLTLSRRSPVWAMVALIGVAAPVLLAHLVASDLMAKPLWMLIELAAAAALGSLAWRHRDRVDARDVGLIGGSAVAALLASVALASVAGWAWAPLAVCPTLLALGWWANRVPDRNLARLPTIAAGAIGLLGAAVWGQWMVLLVAALGGERLTYPLLPDPVDVARSVAAPALAVVALFAWPRSYGRQRHIVAAALCVVATLILYTMAKQPLAITDEPGFVALGFTERAAITLALAAAGWAIATRTRFVGAGRVLVATALARFVWFDILVHDPVLVAQRAGGWPVLNLAVLTPTLLALALFSMPRSSAWRRWSMALVLVATAAAVRQSAHGTLLTGSFGSGENWGYSAAFLALASVWLWRGLMTGQRDLRIAALALLTLVTIKVFLFDVAALGGLLRILSFLGLGLALIGIGWAYNRLIARPVSTAAQSSR